MSQRQTVWTRRSQTKPIVHTVYLIFQVERSTLEIVNATIMSSATPCIDQSRFFPINHACWDGASHQQAYDRAVAWLRDPLCSLPESIRKMALPPRPSQIFVCDKDRNMDPKKIKLIDLVGIETEMSLDDMKHGDPFPRVLIKPGKPSIGVPCRVFAADSGETAKRFYCEMVYRETTALYI